MDIAFCSMSVTYDFALIDGTDKTISIKECHKDSNLRFKCPCCHDDMLPVQGKLREWHFRHVNSLPCNRNSYLHSTAEQVFYEEYKKCIESGRSFIVDVYPVVSHSSNCCSDKDLGKCLHHEIIDLTRCYKNVLPEKQVFDNGYYFRPDLLLKSDDGKQLWVEIWVSHKTGEKKRQHADVLEIKIVSEDDIQRIRSHQLRQSDPNDDNVRFYLKQSPVREITCNDEDNIQKKGNEFPLFVEDGSDSLLLVHNLGDLKEVRNVDLPWYVRTTVPKWIGLGLPSGTLWSADYLGNMPFIKAMSLYRGMIPTPEQFKELVVSCRETGPCPAGYIGPNGRLLEIYNGDFWTCLSLNKYESAVFHCEFVHKFIMQMRCCQSDLFLKAEKELNLCVRLVNSSRSL